tara:strand:- start:3244 stop:4428 length:1185 start_codon:yes stop_codon:yes gene_type:complete
MNLMDIEFHEIANIFALIEGKDFEDICKSVAEIGVKEPIIIYDGKILDGRNRYRAAIKMGVPFQTVLFNGTPEEAITEVWWRNRTRRHLNSSQAALADAKRNLLTEQYAGVREAAKERQREALIEGNKTRHEAAPAPEQIPEPASDNKRNRGEETRENRAKAAGTNAKYIDVADKIVTERPDLAADVESGKKTISQVAREMRKEELSTRVPPAPSGKYRVIYADPPWKYNDTLSISKDGLVESYGPAEAHYPSMSISELCDLPIKELAEPDAVLFIWTTSPLLEDTFPIIKAWGFAYKTSFVWDKVKHNMGHYNSVRHEFLLVCTRGSCTPDVKKLFDSVQTIERQAHSKKPEEFREIIDTIYPEGTRIELFARGRVDGWDAWGNQATDGGPDE